ncbi:MAG: YlxR family protein [Chloroflexi bacterium]|nr:MAG: YlxR family protein [Chloroflexota bacterium]
MKGRAESVRTCVACREEAGKRQLIRVVRRPGGGVAVDRTGRLPGRAAYLHPNPACIEIARKRGSLDRALGATVQPEVWSELVPRPSPDPLP